MVVDDSKSNHVHEESIGNNFEHVDNDDKDDDVERNSDTSGNLAIT